VSSPRGRRANSQSCTVSGAPAICTRRELAVFCCGEILNKLCRLFNGFYCIRYYRSLNL
jgi:hypothetical protein